MSSMETAAQSRGRYYHGWNIVAACIVSQVAVNGLAANCFSLFLPRWSADFHVPPSQLLFAIGLMTLAGSALAPIVGGWADKYPSRWLFGLGLAGNALFCLLLSFATAPWQILALYALILPFPIVLSAAIPANSLISRWFVKRLGLAIGLCSFGLGVAGVLLPPIVSHLLPIIGWRTLWRIDAAVCALVILPVVLLTLRNRPDENRDGLHYLTSDTELATPPAHGHAAGGVATSGLTWRDVLRRRNFWLVVGMVMPLLAIDIGIMQNVAPYAVAHGFPAPAAGQLISVMFTAHLSSALVIGWFCDRFGTRPPLITLIIIAILGCTTLSFGTGLAMAMLGCVLIGMVGASFTLLPIGIAAEFGPDGFGKAFGSAMFFLPAAAFAPVAVAKVQEITGSYTTSFMGIAAVMIIPATLLLFYKPRKLQDRGAVAI